MLATRRRTLRLTVSALSVLLMLLLSAQSVLAAVAWTSPVRTSPSYAYNFGRGLARTVTSTGTSLLHEQYSIETDASAHVFYRRGSSSTTSWGTAYDVTLGIPWATDGAIAASGRTVFVAFQQYTDLNDFDPSAEAQHLGADQHQSRLPLGMARTEGRRGQHDAVE